MKKPILIILTSLAVFFIFQLGFTASAHIVRIDPDSLPAEDKVSLPPSKVNINGVTTTVIAEGYDSEILQTPTEEAPLKYMIGTEMQFSLNENYITAIVGEVSNIDVIWNMGDGNKVLSGTTLNYKYSKPGTYLIDVDIVNKLSESDVSTSSRHYAQQLDFASVLVNMIPASSYKLPEATLIGLTNPIITTKDRVQYVFDATHSIGQKPLETFIDYGDGHSTQYPLSIHTYRKASEHHHAILRITDRFNFFSDESFVFFPSQDNKPSILATYKSNFFDKFDTTLNQSFNENNFFSGSRLRLVLNVLYVGFMQIFLTPLLSLLLVLYGYKKSGFSVKKHLNFSTTHILLQLFFSMILVSVALYFDRGHYWADVFTKVLLILSCTLLFLQFFRILMRKGDAVLEKDEYLTLGVALGALPRPYSFMTLMFSLFFVNIYDSMYLLTIFVFGMTLGYLLLISLGVIFRLIFTRT